MMRSERDLSYWSVRVIKSRGDYMRRLGTWNDNLIVDEIDFTESAIDILSTVGWGKKLLEDKSIKATLKSLEFPVKMVPEDILVAKSKLFEIRFAHAIHRAGYAAEYEYNTGVNNTSVDFMIHNKGNDRDWLVELTGLRDSEKIKKTPVHTEDFSSYISPNNDEEMNDIIRAQSLILSKVTDKDNNPIKSV